MQMPKTATLTAMLVLLGTPALNAQQQPPMTDADALRMLGSHDFRERDAAMYYVWDVAKSGREVSAELTDALVREAQSDDWGHGRPEPGTLDGWGEIWADYRSAIGALRAPSTVPVLLEMGCCTYDLAEIGREAVAPTIAALESAGNKNTEEVALRALTVMRADGILTGREQVRIEAALERRLTAGEMSLLGVASAFDLIVTLDSDRLIPFVQRAANDHGTASRLVEYAELATKVRTYARETLEAGYVPAAIKFRRPPH